MIAIGSDHGGYELKKIIIDEFKSIDFKDYGTFSTDSVDYPDIAIPLAEDVANGICERGILVCRSGIGMDIMANKVRGIRAALCFNSKMAEMAKRHEDANIITIGADYVSNEEAIKMVRAWLDSNFEGERHQRRIDKIKNYENNK
ncbi:MAG: ribose 5-phosphate isomerase B [Clostridia bacterium]|nr:ribose 5-phosphate isomerase B [Clostridia bacterium]